MKLKILVAVFLSIPLLVWSCGGGSTGTAKKGDDTGVDDTASGDTTGNVLNDCAEGESEFAAVNTLLQSNCVSCHGGGVEAAKTVMDLSSDDMLILRGALSEASQLEGETSTEKLVAYIVSDSHQGSGAIGSSESELADALAPWYTAESACLTEQANSSSADENSTIDDPDASGSTSPGSGTEEGGTTENDAGDAGDSGSSDGGSVGSDSE